MPTRTSASDPDAGRRRLSAGGKRCIRGSLPRWWNRVLRHGPVKLGFQAGLVVSPISCSPACWSAAIRHRHRAVRTTYPRHSTFPCGSYLGRSPPGDRQLPGRVRRWCGATTQNELFALLQVPRLECWASRPRWSAPAHANHHHVGGADEGCTLCERECPGHCPARRRADPPGASGPQLRPTVLNHSHDHGHAPYPRLTIRLAHAKPWLQRLSRLDSASPRRQATIGFC